MAVWGAAAAAVPPLRILRGCVGIGRKDRKKQQQQKMFRSVM